MKAKVINWWLIAIVLIGAIFPANAAFSEESAAGGADKTNVLTNKVATINGSPIAENVKLSDTEPLDIKVSFDVPVIGDVADPSEAVHYGDTASFQLSKGFKVLSGTIIPLKTKDGILVAHATLVTDPVTKIVTAQVVFDGDEDIFTDEGVSAVKGEFEAQLQYDASGDGGTEGDHTVMILDKTYTVNVPPAEIIYSISKEGTPNLATKVVDWEVKVSATQSGNSVDLAGYSIKDVLTQVGEYENGSFAGGTGESYANGELSYIFPAGSTGEQTLSFQTKIPDSKYFASGGQSIPNTVQLLDEQGAQVKNGSDSTAAFFTPEWIVKSGSKGNEYNGGVYDPQNRTITWTITANQMGAGLENLTIVDVLEDGLSWQSARWIGGDIIASEPAGGRYILPGTTNGQVQLEIVSKVDDTDTTTEQKTYYNQATLDWNGKPAGVTTSSERVGVTIGYNALSKSGSINYSDRTVTWTVTVDAQGQTLPDGMDIYDLLIYGDDTSGFDINQATGIPSGIDQTKITPRYNQKYEGNFTGAGSLAVVPISQNGERVGDLLIISGLSTTTLNSFSYDSLILNPAIYAGDRTLVQNSASLFTGNKYLNSDTASVTYNSNMLAKELLHRDAQDNPVAGVNNRTSTASEGFDYVDKTVIFRLSVNADSLDFNHADVNVAGEPMGIATLTDTLPDGWEFIKFESGEDYLVFEGEKGSSSSVTAKGATPDTINGTMTEDKATVTFTFNPLDKPYVILVKAKPKAQMLDKYFNDNKTTFELNKLKLAAARWSNGVAREQGVSMESVLLSKSNTQPEAGVLNWTVNYNPYELAHTGNKIEDTLPIGMDLRTDSKGQLLIDGNITVREMELDTNGTLKEGALIPVTLGQNVSYDAETRTLTFTIADSSKAYRFTYVTDITGETGTLTNRVRLSDGQASAGLRTVSYSISSYDGAASLLRSGWLEVTKTDGTNGLAGAEFTLFTEDESTIIRQAVSGADGKLKLKVIPDGEYVLKETVAPTGYTLSNVKYKVVVSTPPGGKPATSIDNKTGTDSNKLTVANFLTGTAGNLEISKTVAGNDGDLSKKFDFTVTFTGAAGTYNYVGTGGANNGTISSGGTVALASGESILITGLPKDAGYTVTEADYSTEGYSTTSPNATGTIVADDTQFVVFTNTKDKPGSLVISKTVNGNAGDRNKEFDFTITFNATGSFNYTGAGGVADGTIDSGDTISLAHGQSISIDGLPKGTTYTVTEADYAIDGYATTSTGDKGAIVTDDVQTAAFTNTRNVFVPGPGPGPSPGPSQPVVPSNPDKEDEDKPEVEEPETEQPSPEITDPENTGGNQDDNTNGDGGESSGGDVLNTDDENRGNKDGNVLGESDAVQGGTPKTGDTSFKQMAQFGLIFFLLALAGLFWADSVLRKRRTNSN